MENASNALIIAGGILIGVLILSLAVYLFANFGTASAEIHKQKDMNEINKFNTQFTSYEGKECTVHDIVSVANLAINNNTNYSLTAAANNNYYITVAMIGGKSGNVAAIRQELQKYLLNRSTGKIDMDKVNGLVGSNNTNKYSCTVDINSNTKRVQKVTFKEI